MFCNYVMFILTIWSFQWSTSFRVYVCIWRYYFRKKQENFEHFKEDNVAENLLFLLTVSVEICWRQFSSNIVNKLGNNKQNSEKNCQKREWQNFSSNFASLSEKFCRRNIVRDCM